ncbi:hypothetical protein UPYG_G00059260 [Umbra pygmaea]|uniref:THD domain-containing protein n=1 Tax=Umbra pygmaea TaxID=75934 RepID=A0ABD0XCR1_UMBPY
MDVESQMDSVRPRGRCLDIFLVGTVIFLFLTVSAGFVLGSGAIMQLQSKLDGLIPVPTEPLTTDPTYKMQNVAYIQPENSELKKGTMSWVAFNYGETSSVSNLYFYDNKQHTLRLKQDGYYFLYLDLNFTCTGKCLNVTLTINVTNNNKNMLTCKVDLPKWSPGQMNTVTHKCWTVKQLTSNSKLLSHMEVSTDTEKALWKLEHSNSAMGVFLVG